MNTVAFDTLKMARRLEAGGFSAKQAESAAEAFAEVVQNVPAAATSQDLDQLETTLQSQLTRLADGLRSEMASKHDLERLGTELRSEIAELGNQLRSEMATKLDVQTLRAETAETKADILKWMFGAMAAQVGVIVALLKLIP